MTFPQLTVVDNIHSGANLTSQKMKSEFPRPCGSNSQTSNEVSHGHEAADLKINPQFMNSSSSLSRDPLANKQKPCKNLVPSKIKGYGAREFFAGIKNCR